WLLGQVMHWFATGERRADPDMDEQYRTIAEHYEAMLDHYGTHTGVNMARKHIGWYTKGLTGSAEFRNTVNQEPDAKVVQRMLADFYAPFRGQPSLRPAALPEAA
ncbi:tRNA-dihydrouridine synthase, partial [Clostridium perfringens]